MALTRDDAIVLSRVEYSETSQILVLFTRSQGKVRAIAKGARRSTKTRFTPGIDLLEVGTVVLSARRAAGDALAIITEWRQVLALAGLRDGLDRVLGAQYAVEVTAGLTEDTDPHPHLFDELLRLLTDLSIAAPAIPRVVRFQRSLLDEIGLTPVLRNCVECGRASNLSHFSSFQGGMMCSRCAPGQAETYAVSLPTLAVLNGDGRRDTPQGFAGALHLLNYHIAHLLGKQPRLAPALGGMAETWAQAAAGKTKHQ